MPRKLGMTGGSRTDLEAREFAQMLLGALSLVIWFAVAFGLAIAWQVNDDTPAREILTAGGIGLLAAALPWLGYRPLVSRLRRRGPAPRG